MQREPSYPDDHEPAGETAERAWTCVGDLAEEADVVTTHLRQSWQHDAPEFSEEKAMYYVVGLMYNCEQTFTRRNAVQPWHRVHELVRLHHDVDTRYEVEAALATILGFGGRLRPYELAINRVIEGPHPRSEGVDDICRALREHEPDAVASWHAWLWPSESDSDHGDASVLAIAVERLSQSMRHVLDLAPGSIGGQSPNNH